VEKLDAEGLFLEGDLRNALAKNFRGLWSNGGVCADLDRTFRAIANGALDAMEVWGKLTVAYEAVAAPKRRMQVLGGFINALNERDVPMVGQLLDAALANPALGSEFPTLQASIVIDERGVARLKRYISLERSNANDFYGLVGGRATDPIPAKDLQEILSGIAAKLGGVKVACEILYMRLHSDRDQKRPSELELREAGRELLQSVIFANKENAQDHRMGSLVRACLTGDGGLQPFKSVCENFKKAVAAHKAYAFRYDDLIQSFFKARPADALEIFLGGDAANQKLGVKILGESTRHSKNPFKSVTPEIFIQWCEQSPADHYLAAAAVVPQFQNVGETSNREFSASAMGLLERAPDPVEFLKIFVHRFRPMSWSGSRAAIMESHIPLLKALESHADHRIADIAKLEGLRLTQEAERERLWETENDRNSDGRFE
jgi:hypothetical protein